MKQEWERKPFESCVEPVEYTRKIQRKDFLDDGQFPIISQEADFTNGYWNDEVDVFRLSTPVVVFGDHTQVLKYVDFDFVLGADGVKILQPRDFLRPKFFFYQLWAANLVSRGYARHYRLLKELEIKVPPLPEQQRIVGILDEAFEGIAAAKANAEKNLENVRAIFESHLQSVFQPKNAYTRLSELTTDITDGDHMPPPKASTGVPFITISDIVKPARTIDFSNTFTVPKKYFEGLKPNKKPRVGDVLYTVTGATLGIPVLVRQEIDFCFQRHIGLIRPKPDTDSTWLSYALLSPQVFRQATVGSTGAAQKTVSLAVLRNISVPKISFSDQKQIAAKLEAIERETQRLDAIYQQKIAALDALKKSLLHQAFSGAL